eukprot:1161802-Pelagomonas_calceolata.AAC.1
MGCLDTVLDASLSQPANSLLLLSCLCRQVKLCSPFLGQRKVSDNTSASLASQPNSTQGAPFQQLSQKRKKEKKEGLCRQA